MAEVTSVYSVYDLVLQVAKAAKIAYYGSDGQGIPMVPVNEHDFDRCLRCVNDGIKRFIHDAPPDGWKWQERLAEITFGIVEITGTVDSGSSTTLVDLTLATAYDADDDLNGYYVYDTTKKIQALITDYTTLTGTVIVGAWLDYYGNASSLTPAAADVFSVTDVATVAGDKSRYFLPDDFSEIAGEIQYKKGSNVGHIQWDHVNVIRDVVASGTSSGNPTIAAVRSILNRKWELVVHPSPTAAKTVQFPYRTGFNKLQAVTGTAFNGSTTALVTTDSHIWKIYPNDYFNGWTIEIISGTGRKSYAKVTDFVSNDGTSAVFTVAKWLAADGTSTGASPALNSIYYLTDGLKHSAGQMFDMAIRSAIMVEVAEEFGQLSYDAVGKYMQMDLPEAHALDARMRPRTVGSMQSGSRQSFRGTHQPGQHRSWSDVSYG